MDNPDDNTQMDAKYFGATSAMESHSVTIAATQNLYNIGANVSCSVPAPEGVQHKFNFDQNAANRRAQPIQIQKPIPSGTVS